MSQLHSTLKDDIRIIEYAREHQPFFEAFNRVWIEELFEMEPVDEWVLQHPDEAILATGGAILMATCNGQIAGTVGLRKVDSKTLEFTKMAVSKDFQRRGIAEKITYASLQRAKELGASKVILYSNRKNAAAIRLYEKVWFKHLPVEAGVYNRANVKMEINIDSLFDLSRER